MTVRTRIAPSPTGYLHFGTARTALFNYLYAKQHGGQFLMRIEDTDTERNREEYDADIPEQMQWLGLTPDETYRQSKRIGEHKAALEQMIASGAAYISKEQAKDGSGKEVEVVRLMNPGKSITFTDEVRGAITFDTTELGDFVIARAVDDPLYHLAVVVDDAAMGITHVIRGEDHISNTPRQILIQEALGYERPVYAHIPLILAQDRSKMSKRKHETSIKQYREKGYLAPALTNYLALLGWNPGTDQEVFSLEALIKEFDLAKIQKGGAVFDIEKLKWFNRHYLLEMPASEFKQHALGILKDTLAKRNIPWNEVVAQKLLPLLRERTDVWESLRLEAEGGEYDYFFASPTLDATVIPGKGSTSEAAKNHLEKAANLLSTLPENPEPEAVKQAVWDYAEAEGRAAVLWPLRYVLSGKERSPDPFTIASVIGTSAAVLRIRSGIEKM